MYNIYDSIIYCIIYWKYTKVCLKLIEEFVIEQKNLLP